VELSQSGVGLPLAACRALHAWYGLRGACCLLACSMYCVEQPVEYMLCMPFAACCMRCAVTAVMNFVCPVACKTVTHPQARTRCFIDDDFCHCCSRGLKRYASRCRLRLR